MLKYLTISTICLTIAGCLFASANEAYHSRPNTFINSPQPTKHLSDLPEKNGKNGDLSHRVRCPKCTNFDEAVPATTSTIETSNPLDLEIIGVGYFSVQLTDGSTAYTTYGHFHLDENDLIVTSEGYPVLPQIAIPDGSTNLTISQSGIVSVIYLGLPTQIGQIQLTRFPDPAALQYIGNSLYIETPLSGPPQTGTAGEDGFGTIEQGFLEVTNANSQSRIYTAISDVVVTDPPPPNSFPGIELNPLNNDGNLGDGHNVYANVANCHAYPTTQFIGSGFGGSSVDSMPVFNYGQILIRSLLTKSQRHHLRHVHILTFLAMSGFDDSYPPLGNLTILVWNSNTDTWETLYTNTSFPVQTLATINDPVQFQKVTLDLSDPWNYVDENGFINLFIYTPYSGTIDNQQNPAQIELCCFELCTS